MEPAEDGNMRSFGTSFYAALIAGLMLAGLGAIGEGTNWLRVTTSNLILCIGLGIVLGAFGGTATIKYKGIVVTGVAAIGTILFAVVDHVTKSKYVYIHLDGDLKGVASVELIGGEKGGAGYPGYLKPDKLYETVVIGDHELPDRFTLTISYPQNASGSELPFECINQKEIGPYLGKGKILQWRFDKEHAVLTADNGRRVVSHVGSCPTTGALQAPSHSLAFIPAIYRRAFADGIPNFDELLENLGSDQPAVRRNARESLANAGLIAIRPLFDRLAVSADSYRTQLGIIVAITEMLRDRQFRNANRSAIIKLLSDDEVRGLVRKAIDDDRTIRVYASEFCYGLGDPRMARIALEMLSGIKDNGESQYQLVLVIGGALPYLRGEESGRIRAKLQDLRPSTGTHTQELIDKMQKQAS